METHLRHLLMLIACSAMLAGSSCGDPLVDGTYRGQPLFVLGGTIQLASDAPTYDPDHVRVAVLWIGAEQLELFGEGVSESEFPARYQFSIYEEPVAGAYQDTPDADGRFAVARVILFEDDDLDGTVDPGERLLGGSDEELLAYFPDAGTSDFLGGQHPAGYRVMNFQSCMSRVASASAAMMTPAGSSDGVDLTLSTSGFDALDDLNCDSLPDDLCISLLEKLGGADATPALRDLYDQACSERETTTKPDEQLDCLQEAQKEQVSDEVEQLCKEEVVTHCKNEHLAHYTDVGEADQFSKLHAFGECAGIFGPCQDAWDLWQREGDANRAQYRTCVQDTFDLVTTDTSSGEYCTDLQQQIDATDDAAQREELQAQYDRECT